MNKKHYIGTGLLSFGFILGFASNAFLNSQKQDTYFESNNISNFFFMSKSEEVMVSKIIKGHWKYICTEMPPDSEYKEIVFGQIVDEGLLDYLQKVVVIGEAGRIGIMNFDERIYRIVSNVTCFDFDSAKIIKETKQIKPDPDGVGRIFTTYTFETVKD